jgi:hypothetical protein
VTPTCRVGNSFCTETLINGSLQPETSFGVDIGEDVRYGDGFNLISWDAYSTNLHNQFLTSVYLDPTRVGVAPCAGCPVFASQNQNLGNARYQGLEMALARQPGIGFGYKLQGALIKGYPYGLVPSFYATTAGPNTTNLAIINGLNFQSSGPSGTSSFNSISNHAIPYSQGYGELNFHGRNGIFYDLGSTYYGPNNSYNRPAFFVWHADIRANIDRMSSIQLSIENLTNIYGTDYIDRAGGVPVVLANGKIGLTNGNVVGPRTYRFMLRRSVGY